jgi:proline dehydrogenase
MEIDDALRVAEAINGQGITVSLDSLGESVTSVTEAHQAAEIYHRLLDELEARKLNANISVKLTQMGLDLSTDLAESLAVSLTAHAKAVGSFVRIDMEDSSLTQVTLNIVRRLNARPELRGSVGVVIQAYLYRSEADIEQLLAEGIRVRLCKGAYNEPAEVAFPRKADVGMIAEIKDFASRHPIDPSRFEFQMLYGVRRDLQSELVREGYNVRVYVPFGRAWYPYFMRRLAERPANVLFIAKNMLRR